MGRKKAYKTYMYEVFDHSGFYPTWPPLSKISVGDVVRIESDGTFSSMTTLKDLGIKFAKEKTKGEAKYSYRSKGASAIASTVKAKAKSTPAKVYTEIDISFTNGDSIIFDLSNVQYTEILDFNTVESQVIEMSKQGKWEKDWLLVANVVTAKKATILVANSKTSKVTYQVDGTISDGLVSNLAEANLTITGDHNMAFKLTSSGPLTPMAKCYEINKRLFSAPRLAVIKRAPTKAASKASSGSKSATTRSYKYFLNQDSKFIERVDQPADWD